MPLAENRGTRVKVAIKHAQPYDANQKFEACQGKHQGCMQQNVKSTNILGRLPAMR